MHRGFKAYPELLQTIPSTSITRFCSPSPSGEMRNNCEVFCQTIFAYFWFVSLGAKQRAICVEVIKLLHAERERRGISKYTLSAQCGLAQQTISYMERELRHPSFETILRVADGMGV